MTREQPELFLWGNSLHWGVRGSHSAQFANSGKHIIHCLVHKIQLSAGCSCQPHWRSEWEKREKESF